MSASVPSRIEETVELVKKLCLAEMAVTTYSAEHPFGRKSVREAYECLDRMLKERNEPVALSAAGRTILCEGHPLEEKNQMVARLAKSLEDIHVTNLFFRPGLAAEDFDRFFGVLAKGGRHINENGGLQALMQQAQIRHIELKDVSYVMVTDDQKIVSRDAKVVEGGGGGSGGGAGEGTNEGIVRYMVGRVMKEAEERKWLITEIKNNPQKVAELISEGIELAASRQELGLVGGTEITIEGIIQNIRAVGLSLAGSAGDSPGTETDEELEAAVVEMEREIRERSTKLTSSTVARGFINEILAVITSFSDQIKARQISTEFLKGETNLRKTEEILKTLTPQSESAEQFLVRIQTLLKDRGVKEEQLGDLLDIATGKRAGGEGTPADGSPAPQEAMKRPRKPRRPAAPRNLADDVFKEIKHLGVADDPSAPAAQELGDFIEKKVRERAKIVREEAETLKRRIARRDSVLGVLPVLMLLWDADGRIDFVSRPLEEPLGLKAGDSLSESLLGRIQSSEFPLAASPADIPVTSTGGERVTEILSAIFKLIKDGEGRAIGALMNLSKIQHPPPH